MSALGQSGHSAMGATGLLSAINGRCSARPLLGLGASSSIRFDT